MKEPQVRKSQIDQLIKERFPYISSPLAQKLSQLTHQKHLYRIANNRKPVLLINKIKKVVQDQTTPADVRRFLSSQFLPQPIKSVLQKPFQTRWNDYVSGVREIYKNRNYLVYPTTEKKRKLYQVDIQRGGITVDGPTMSKPGNHRLQIKQGGTILLDGKEPMTPTERNVAMELMGELFGQLKINQEWSKTKENIIKTLVAGKIYQQGQQKQKPYLTMPVHDFAKLRKTLKSMKSMRYPQQQQNRLISSITQNDKSLQSYKQVRHSLIPLLTTYHDLRFLKQITNLMLKVPITPWTEFWQQWGPLIYKTKETYDALHNSQNMLETFHQIDDSRSKLLLPPSDGRMLVWTFDPEKKTVVVIIRGLGFIVDEEDGYDTLADGSLMRETCEMVIDISTTAAIVLITNSIGDYWNELLFLPYQLARNPQVDSSLEHILETAIVVWEGKATSSYQRIGDSYYRLHITDDDYTGFLPSKTYRF